MEIQSVKSVQINEDVILQVAETEQKVMISVRGGFVPMAVVLTFEEFKEIVNAMNLISVQRSLDEATGSLKKNQDNLNKPGFQGPEGNDAPQKGS